MARHVGAGEPVRAAQFVKCLGIGGTERQLLELLLGLDRSRVEPRLACLMKHGEFLEPVRALGFDPPEFHLRGTLLQPNTAMQAARLAAWLSRERASVLHCHDFYTNVVGSLAARFVGVPWIVSRRDLGVWGRAVHRQLLAAVTRLAPAVLCNSRAARDLVVNREGVPSERVHVVPNGLSLERFDTELRKPPQTPVPRLDGSAPIVAIVANLKLLVKGHGNFLQAAAEVHRVMPEVRFLLVGDGELRPAIELQALRLGLGDVVIFTGYRTDVPALLARSTIAVSSSSSEGLSNAIMEAMAAERPVVATAVGGSVELVQDGRTGFLVPSGEPALMAARILTLLRAPTQAADMGRAGRRRIEDEFSARRLSERVTSLYVSLAEQGSGLPAIA
jgi:glycosyltransferase involved in cell wall biosynthesis